MLKGKLDKLEPKSEVCLLVGYPKETTGYLFYSWNDNKVFVSTNAKFLENDYMSNFTPNNGNMNIWTLSYSTWDA